MVDDEEEDEIEEENTEEDSEEEFEEFESMLASMRQVLKSTGEGIFIMVYIKKHSYLQLYIFKIIHMTYPFYPA